MTRRTTLGLLAAASLAAAVSAPALATSEPETDMPITVDIIEGIDWALLRQQVDGALVDLPDDVGITLLMQDGTASGSGGCNSYGASYERDRDALTFGVIEATEMYCPDASDLESAYFTNLAAVTTAFSTGGTLVMTGTDGDPILEFEPAGTFPLPTDGIEGLSWQLESLVLSDEAGLTPVPQEVVASIVLEDGQATGSGGCNGFSASYELDGSALSFSEVLSTRMACPEPTMGLEQALFAQLGSVAGWSYDGGSVTLHDASGSALARLVPADADEPVAS
jgi:heat shock protein HslJ